MKNLLLTFLLLILPAAANAQAKTPPCSKWLRGFFMWEDETPEGKLVAKSTIKKFQPWSDMGEQFDGVLVVAALPNALKSPVLEVEYIPAGEGKAKVAQFKTLLPFSRNAKYKHFDDFKAKEFFGDSGPGTYAIRLKSAAGIFCEEKHAFGSAD